MTTPKNAVFRLIDRNLGRCPRCARSSFLVFAGAAALTTALSIFTAPGAVLAVAWLATATLGTLWLAHITAFAVRRGLSPATTPVVNRTAGRRAAVAEIVRALGWAAWLTAAPSLARAADPPTCVTENCQNKPKQKSCWDCCQCQYDNCTGTNCISTWQTCNADCGKLPA